MNGEFESSLRGLGEFLSFLETFLSNLNCGSLCSHRVLVSCEEIFSNICNYAYGSNIGKIFVDISVANDKLRVEICDEGAYFDPTSYEIDPSRAKNSVGGLGIFIAKKLMDKMEYSRDDGKNILVIYKKLR